MVPYTQYLAECHGVDALLVPLEDCDLFERFGAVDADSAVPAPGCEEAAVRADLEGLLARVFCVVGFVGGLDGCWRRRGVWVGEGWGGG